MRYGKAADIIEIEAEPGKGLDMPGYGCGKVADIVEMEAEEDSWEREDARVCGRFIRRRKTTGAPRRGAYGGARFARTDSNR